MPYGSVLSDVVQSSVTGSPPQFNDGAGTQTGTLCRAWVNYNGSTQVVTASFNVSSVTRNSTGNYTVNMTNALSDAKYAISFGMNSGTDGSFVKLGTSGGGASTPTTSSFVVITTNYAATYTDYIFYASIFR
jgi:hypothetical protein